MSEPTKCPTCDSPNKKTFSSVGWCKDSWHNDPAYSAEDLRRADEIMNWWLSYPDAGDDPMSHALHEKLAAEFAAVRRERDQVAEKLAEVLRWALKYAGRSQRDCTPEYWKKLHDSHAALADYERSNHA